MNPMRTSLLLIVVAALTACPSPNPEPGDGGHGGVDARVTLLDGSTLLGDTGSATQPDAGVGASDSGSVPHGDSGLPTSGDAGQVPVAACSEVTASAPDPQNYDALLGCLRNPAESSTDQQQAVKVFVAAVESHGGFPIRAGGDAVFVYVRDPAYDGEISNGRRGDPLRLAGELNGWTPAALSSEKAGFFHLRVPFAGDGSKRWGYKFVAKDGSGQDVWFADPFARRFLYDANGEISLVVGEDSVGHLEWIRSVHATLLGNDRSIVLYVPRGYDSAAASARRYPVVYMHDGNNLFDPTAIWGGWKADVVADEEIGQGRAKEFLVVGVPNNSDRMNEYTHTADTVDNKVYPGKGAQYADFLVHDLKPLIDARYRTLTDKPNTAILGSSLGGLISYYVGLQYPDLFKYVGGMSSTFGWGMPPNKTVLDLYAGTADLGSRGQVFYLDSGGSPPPGGIANCTYTLADDSGDSDNYCVTLKMKDLLVAAGYDTFPDDPSADRLTPDGVNILHWWESGAQHNEAAWNARLPMAFRLFFRP
ncbi:MAG: alpha/beta hydrolase-fold protein [Myxococcales bacterium]